MTQISKFFFVSASLFSNSDNIVSTEFRGGSRSVNDHSNLITDGDVVETIFGVCDSHAHHTHYVFTHNDTYLTMSAVTQRTSRKQQIYQD